jgi:hypothetical protein
VLDLTLRVATLEGDEDHDATWMFGHTERIEFRDTFVDDDELWVKARVHVPCRHLREGGDGGAARCTAHRFRGTVPPVPHDRQARRLGDDRFRLVEGRRMRTRTLPAPPPSPRSLPVADMPNPCAEAACRTGDNRQGAACCRDLQVDIRCDEDHELLEALLRNRKAPYLCKVDREDEELLNAEIISACGYLLEDGIHCSLHGRDRADGRPAKPLLCSEWPKARTGLHPGCVFKSRSVKL